MAKLTIEQVRKAFADRGYVLLEEEYKNAKTKMKYLCPHHPDKELYINYSNLKAGYGCPYCGGTAKLSYEEVKKEFEIRGYILLDTEYVNNRTKMRYICPNHPDKELSIKFAHLKNGHGCPYCARQGKPSMEDVVALFESRGLRLMDDEYVSAHHPMRYICLKHPNVVRTISFNNLKNGRGCPDCANEMRKADKSHLWKGGVTKVNVVLRHAIKDWKLYWLSKYNFRCAVSGKETHKLHVHHTIPFYVIRDRVFSKYGLSFEEGMKVCDIPEDLLEFIINDIKKEHENVEGIPLAKELHKLLHDRYGHNVSNEQFREFVNWYRETVVKSS